MIRLVCLLTFISSLTYAMEEPPLEPPYTRAASSSSTTLRPIEKPSSISDEGDYFYEGESAPDATYYKMDHLPPISGAAYFRMGSVSSFNLQGDTGRNYKEIYGDRPGLGVLFDYEWQLGHLAGKWTFKASSGLVIGNGTGQFENSSTNSSLVPKETFLFGVMPNTAILNYKLRFSDTQWFIPYVEGGAGYFTFIEYRNDGKKTAFGGAPVASAAGGILISLSILDRNSAGTLYDDYGVTHMWLDLQARRNFGLSKQKDFSSNVFSAGFGFAF